MRKNTLVGIIILIIAVLGMADSLNAQRQDAVVLSAFKPTLEGHQNTAFVETMEVGKEKKKMVVFWIEGKPGEELVAAIGGAMWGDGVAFKIGMKREKILSGNAYVAIDGESQFTGNFDYVGSIYTLIGEVRLLNHTFRSAEGDPLKFKLEKNKGFVHVGGKGKITTDKGKAIKIE